MMTKDRATDLAHKLALASGTAIRDVMDPIIHSNPDPSIADEVIKQMLEKLKANLMEVAEREMSCEEAREMFVDLIAQRALDQFKEVLGKKIMSFKSENN